ncbi:type II secretion system protein N [Novosphingobium huizhouense]|uniref:type II secretion system protein N n=1 Tax=Novosphingobium huizhouense TaxID=2866625 RepID=UPI001CD8A182|nr:type II secretion system protein N [Novosphingobium huizhouense]
MRDLLWWFLVALNALLAAVLFWVVVTPLSPLGDWRPATARLVPPAERAVLYASVDPFTRGGPAAGEPGQAAVTSLALTLFATRTAPGGSGSAILAGADGVQQVIRVGESVQPGVTLAGVAFDHVVLARNGLRETLYLDQSRAAPAAAALVAQNPVRADRMRRAEDLPRPITVQTVRSGIGFGPRASAGRVVGLEVIPQGDGETFRAAGFRPGDLVTAVNGQPVKGAGDAALIAGALQPGATVTVTVERDGRQLPLAITLGQ